MQNSSVASRRNYFIRVGIYLALLLWLGIFMAEKIDLSTADLGRHLENGKWVVENHFNLFEKHSPVHENFYSYTQPGFPVVNHHWGSGVLLYLIFKLSGYSGLSVFYIFLSLAIFSIFFQIAKRNSDFTTAAILSVLLIPLMAERREIRPEILSYFFAAVFFWALWKWQKGELATSRLYVLPIFMIFWVNLHVYFFLGLFLMGVFWISEIGQLIFSKLSDEEFLEKVRGVKNLTAIGILATLASLLNPFGIKGLIYPLQIFKNYGYTIVENKSVSFVENYGIMNSNFFLIKIVLVFLLVSFVLLFFVNRKKMHASSLIFAIFFGVMGWLAIRNFTLLGFFALPILAQNSEGIFSIQKKEKNAAEDNGLAALYVFVCLFAVFSSWQFLINHSGDRGIGLATGNGQAAEFFEQNGVKGPIFNDYDIGGYLIWNVYLREKVFVDNRPEAYPDIFFGDVYKPMQEYPAVFQKVDQEYNFNTIVFYAHDITPWGMNFLKNISQDPGWAKVFEDNFAVIYLKRNDINKNLINKYKI